MNFQVAINYIDYSLDNLILRLSLKKKTNNDKILILKIFFKEKPTSGTNNTSLNKQNKSKIKNSKVLI